MAEVDINGTRNREYKDLSLSMGLNPVTNDVVSVTGIEAVKRSIKNLLSIQCGEVPFFPNLGSRLNELLFEPIDPITTIRIDSEIRATIEGFEPRARVVVLTITPTDDQHKYQIDLTLQLVNLAEPITLTLFLSRLR
jgi:phage baseplate assembly protein W